MIGNEGGEFLTCQRTLESPLAWGPKNKSLSFLHNNEEAEDFGKEFVIVVAREIHQGAT